MDWSDVAVVVPARLASTRLPDKLLLPVAGQPVLAWTLRALRTLPLPADQLAVATGDPPLRRCRAQGQPNNGGFMAVIAPASFASSLNNTRTMIARRRCRYCNKQRRHGADATHKQHQQFWLCASCRRIRDDRAARLVATTDIMAPMPHTSSTSNSCCCARLGHVWRWLSWSGACLGFV